MLGLILSLGLCYGTSFNVQTTIYSLRNVVGRESRSVGGPHYDTMSNCNCHCYLHGSGMGLCVFSS